MKDETKASGFKAQKDRVTFLMCGNVNGFMLKPGLNYKAANPRAFKNKNKALLPVFWMHNPEAWITTVLTEYWFHHCFIPQVRQYLADLNMEFMVLLITENAGGYPLDLYYKGVQLKFLPSNTTSLLQPMSSRHSTPETPSSTLLMQWTIDSEFTLKAYWHKFMIAMCLSCHRPVTEGHEGGDPECMLESSCGWTVSTIIQASLLTRSSIWALIKQSS
ncbi:tigger transposable element-derived protein 1-like [Macrobrachium nipponense]|uniref:tigger transposable element-derived protein 1-like n=1 Tax=Macrobrachium nipponense TaxID=159736 RepID=UPI0030C8A5F8